MKVKGWKNIYHAKVIKRKQEWVTTILSDKVNFRAKNIIRNSEEHYKIIEGSTRQEDIAIINEYIPNNRAIKYVKQKVIEL